MAGRVIISDPKGEDDVGITTIGDKKYLNVLANGFNISNFDYIGLTYVAAGQGVGKIEVVTYKSGGVSGTTLVILTLAYNANNKISSVTKT